MSFSIEQYRAARQSAGILDRSGRGRIALRGGDRRTFLHALLTNDIAALSPGTGCYAAFLTPQGRMMADMRVFELGDVILLDVAAGTTDGLLAKLDQMLFSEDVQLADASGVFGCLSVFGPLAPGVAAAVVQADAADLAGWAPYRNARFDVPAASAPVIVARVDEFGLPGFLLFAPAESVPAIAAAASASGAVAIDAGTADVLRIESGTPEFPVDMDGDTIPLEAGIEASAISYTKGCYPGQEVIIRIRDRGHGRIVRKLVRLSVDGDVVPARGDALLAGDRNVGHVTSAAFSPALGRPVALGYLHRDHIEPGSVVSVAHGAVALPARVLP